MKKDPKYFTDDDHKLILKWEETGLLEGLSKKNKLFLARHLEDALVYIILNPKCEYIVWHCLLCPIIRRVFSKIEKDSVFCKKYPNYNIEILSVIKELKNFYEYEQKDFVKKLKEESYSTMDFEAEIVSIVSEKITRKIKKMIRNNKKEYFKKLLIEKYDKQAIF